MRYVFLDIDGVLNSHAFFERERPLEKFEAMKAERSEKESEWLGHGDEHWESYNLSLCHIDEVCVQRLNRLVAPGVAFVLSSTWRMNHRLHHVQSMLNRKGFQGILIGSTPVTIHQRGREIAQWIEAATGARIFDRKHKGEWPNFVILDDDSDMLHLESHLVKTDVAVGLTDANIDDARRVICFGS